MISEVYNEDCIISMSRYPDKYFDLCITDPPYGVNLKYNTYIDTLENWEELMMKFIPEIKRIAKMVIFPSCSINKLEWIYKNFPPNWLMCWYKGSPGHVAYVGFNDFEPLLVYGKIKGLCIHDYIAINNKEAMGSYGHPCPKPIDWYKKIIKRIDNSVKIQRIIDPFLGSGTCRIVCYDGGFDFVGFELDKEYFDAQEKRFNNFKAQGKLF